MAAAINLKLFLYFLIIQFYLSGVIMAAARNLKLFLYFSHDSIYLALWWRRREIYNYFYIFLMIINNCIINITIRHRQRHHNATTNSI